MSSLPRRYRRTVMSSYATVVAQVLMTLVMTPILTDGLGKTGYGIWSLALSIVLYLELLEFGFARATTRAVAHSEALGDHDAVRRTIATSVAVLAVPGLVALGLGLVLGAAFPSVFDLDPEWVGAARMICVLFAIDLALSIPSDTFGATLAAFQRFDLLNATLVGVILAQSAAWFIVLQIGGGLVALAAVTVAIGLCGQVARFVAARGVLGGVDLSRRWFDRQLLRPLTGQSVWFFIRDMAEIVVYRVDIVVVGLVVGVPEAGVYAVAQKLSLLADRAIRPATVNFFPESAALAARRDEAALRAAVLTGTRISLAVAWPLCLALTVLAGPAIRVWVGPAFGEAAPLVVLLGATAAVKALTRTGVLALEGMGEPRFPAIAFSVEAAINLGLSIALGLTVGIRGIALATLIAATVVELVAVLPYACRRLDIRLPALLWSVAKAHLPALATAVFVGFSLVSRLDGVIGLVGAGAAIAAAYLSVFFFTGLSSEERSRSKIMLLTWAQSR